MIAQKIPNAAQLMTTSRLVLQPSMDILDAIDELVERKVVAAPVVDGENRLLGMLTEKDCLRVLSTSAYENVFKGGTVADYMSPVRMALEPQMDLFRTVEQFLSCNFPSLPVVEEGKLVGRLSRQELLSGVRSFIAQSLKERQEHLERQAKGAERPRSIEEMQQAAASATKEGLAGIFSRNR